ncbi:14301_t:CDS:2, partial [Acaulospora morrowiae]
MSTDHKDYQPSTPLIPRRLLFGNPNLIQPKVSLDGKYIAFISPRNDILNIYVAEVPDDDFGVDYGKELIKMAKPITEDKKRGIRDFHWSFGNQIIFAKDKDGDEDFKLHSVDVKTLEEKILTPFDQTLSYPVKFSPRFPDEAIVAINKPDPAAHSLYRVHLRTGELRLIEENKLHFSGYFVNDDLEVVLATKQTDEAGSSIYKKVGNGVEEQDWKLLITFEIDDVGSSSIISIAHDAFYLKDSRGREFNAIYKIKLDDDELNQVLVAETPSTCKAEIGDVLLDPITHEPIAFQVNYLRKEWFSISPEIFKDLEFLMSYDSSQDGATGKGNSGYRKSDITINSQSLDNQAWTVVFTSDIDPTKYYYFDRKNKKLRYLFSDREDLKDYNLSPMWPVVIKARDGLELVSYLTIPVDKLSNKDDYRPTQPLPLVLN